ncbi:hypothetical protein ZIOFF_020981 [Zingiber officinale]|nr:hypothetical protein ZIOFF_020981 [Zingiber officinale]
MQRLHCNVFMLSYRGYGESDGYPSQHGIIKDAQAALDHLSQRTDIDPSRIVVFGRSLGGAVGAMLARNNPDKVSAIILENTFTSILDMAAMMFPFLKWFIGSNGPKGPKILNYFVRSPWSTIDIIDKVSIHSPEICCIDSSLTYFSYLSFILKVSSMQQIQKFHVPE